jgi:hypothetical protein
MRIDGTCYSEVFMDLSGDPRLNRTQQDAAYRIAVWQQDQEHFQARWRDAEDRNDTAAMAELDELGALHLQARPFRFGPIRAGVRVFVSDECGFAVSAVTAGVMNVELIRAPGA